MNNVALAFAVYNAELYVGGQFTTAGGIPANYIAMWSTTTGIQESIINNAIRVFPNPTNGKFTVALSNSNINEIEIYNVIGEKVFSVSGIKLQTINEITSDFSKGIYFIRLLTDNGEKNQTGKIVIQ